MRVRTWPVVALAAAWVMVLSGCDWTMFGYNAARSRFSPETTISTSNAANLVPKWTGITGGSVDSSPAVVNGVLYVGSDDNKLYAFDANGTHNCSGTPKRCAPLWTAATRGAVRSSPAVVNGEVYVGSDDNNLWVFDANGTKNCSGTPKICTRLWTARTGGAVRSSPVVVNGVVYVDSYDTNLYAFDANGKINCSGTPTRCAPLWTAPSGNVGVDSSPAVANGVVYIGAVSEGCGRLFCFGVSFLNAFDANGKINCSAVPKTCAPLWTAVGNVGQMDSTPAVANGLVYFGRSSDNGNNFALAGFDATGTRGCSGTPKTCSPVWTSGPINGLGVWVSSPAIANGMIYVGGTLDSTDHHLYAFNATGQATRWTANTDGAVTSSPAVANGVVYVGSNSGTFFAFDAKTGTQLWTATTRGLINSSPAIANGRVYVGSDDGAVYAFGLP
jgi:outer membrane protein assembly factor BamB